jgi:hypothetical protein
MTFPGCPGDVFDNVFTVNRVTGLTGYVTSKPGGYSTVTADSIGDVTSVAKGGPAVAAGGNAEEYKTSEM